MEGDLGRNNIRKNLSPILHHRRRRFIAGAFYRKNIDVPVRAASFHPIILSVPLRLFYSSSKPNSRLQPSLAVLIRGKISRISPKNSSGFIRDGL